MVRKSKWLSKAKENENSEKSENETRVNAEVSRVSNNFYENQEHPPLNLPPGNKFAIINLIAKMTQYHVNKNPFNVPIPENVYFRCNLCGECCKNTKYRIPVSILDMKRWLDTGNKDYLFSLDYYFSHPRHAFFIIIKQEFTEKMLKERGEIVYQHFIELNPSLKTISSEEGKDCIFYDSINNLCSIYQQRPTHCIIYPYQSLFHINFNSYYDKIYKKISKMRLKEKSFKNFDAKENLYHLFCPPETLEENPSNLRKLHQKKWQKRLNKMIIADIFSGNLYFSNRRDIFEKVYQALFSK